MLSVNDFNQPYLLLRDLAAGSSGIAIQFGGEAWTYRDFFNLVSSQSARLQKLLPDTEQPRVAIVLEKSPLAYATEIAAMAIGGVFCPISPSNPGSHIEKILSIFDPDCIVSDTLNTDNFPRNSVKAPIFSGMPERISEIKAFEPDQSFGGYVIFTSGSTGDPKGVAVSNTALGNYLSWSANTGSFGKNQRVSQHPELSFDLSILDTLTTLFTGGVLCPLVSKRDKLFPKRFIFENKITTWVSVPSVMDQVSRDSSQSEEISSLKNWYFCGEALFEKHLRYAQSIAPGSFAHNLYGPTEATVSVTEKIIPLDDDFSSAIDKHSIVSAGAPIGQMAIRTDSLNNEIEILGPQVADGYLGAGPENNAKFYRDERTGQRTYKTGDSGVIQDSDLFLRGRIDRQIKRFGYRIDLAQVEAVLGEFVSGGSVVAVFTDEADLVLIYEDDSISPREFLDAATTRLPAYAVPNRFLAMSNIPRTANDKLDAKKVSEAIKNDEFK